MSPAGQRQRLGQHYNHRELDVDSLRCIDRESTRHAGG